MKLSHSTLVQAANKKKKLPSSSSSAVGGRGSFTSFLLGFLGMIVILMCLMYQFRPTRQLTLGHIKAADHDLHHHREELGKVLVVGGGDRRSGVELQGGDRAASGAQKGHNLEEAGTMKDKRKGHLDHVLKKWEQEGKKAEEELEAPDLAEKEGNHGHFNHGRHAVERLVHPELAANSKKKSVGMDGGAAIVTLNQAAHEGGGGVQPQVPGALEEIHVLHEGYQAKEDASVKLPNMTKRKEARQHEMIQQKLKRNKMSSSDVLEPMRRWWEPEPWRKEYITQLGKSASHFDPGELPAQNTDPAVLKSSFHAQDKKLELVRERLAWLNRGRIPSLPPELREMEKQEEGSGRQQEKNEDFQAKQNRERKKKINKQRRQEVVEAIRYSWEGYKEHAFPKDEYMPISKSAQNWVNGGHIGLTAADSFDTLFLAGLKEECGSIAEYFDAHHSFDVGGSDASVFESSIRVLGGLLSAYELSGHINFLEKAKDLGHRLEKAFSGAPHHMPDNYVNLKRGTHHGAAWAQNGHILSEMGLGPEFRQLSYLSKDKSFKDLIDDVLDFVDAQCDPISGLCRRFFVSNTGRAASGPNAGLGSFGDSYYEYLLKQWLQTNKTETRLLQHFIQTAENFIADGHFVKVERIPGEAGSSSPTLSDKKKKSAKATAANDDDYSPHHKSLSEKVDEIDELFMIGSSSGSIEHLSCFSGGMYALSFYHGFQDWKKENGYGVDVPVAFNDGDDEEEKKNDGDSSAGFKGGIPISALPARLVLHLDVAEQIAATCHYLYRMNPSGLSGDRVTVRGGNVNPLDGETAARVEIELQKLKEEEDKINSKILSGQNKGGGNRRPATARISRTHFEETNFNIRKLQLKALHGELPEDEEVQEKQEKTIKKKKKESVLSYRPKTSLEVEPPARLSVDPAVFGVAEAQWILRPETVESFFYLWRVTRKQKYRDWGYEILQAANQHCKVPPSSRSSKEAGGVKTKAGGDAPNSSNNTSGGGLVSNGYTGIKNPQMDLAKGSGARRKEGVGYPRIDKMESFWIAETLKYLLLLFSEDSAFNLDTHILSTEAHIFRVQQTAGKQQQPMKL